VPTGCCRSTLLDLQLARMCAHRGVIALAAIDQDRFDLRDMALSTSRKASSS
jgi:hypothetical protein